MAAPKPVARHAAGQTNGQLAALPDLVILFASALLAATILPLPSEVTLAGLLVAGH